MVAVEVDRGMFEQLKLIGPTERSIVVQTRKGTDIKNLVEIEPGFPERQRYQLLLRTHGEHWVERKPASGVYNCAGHVWASRRTAILEVDQWELVLQEDNYRRLPDHEPPVPGDLVLYVDTESDEPLHVGEILGLRPGLGSGSRGIPWVLSKWNSTSGEVMHHLNQVPYLALGFRVRTEFWTDRSPRAELQP